MHKFYNCYKVNLMLICNFRCSYSSKTERFSRGGTFDLHTLPLFHQRVFIIILCPIFMLVQYENWTGYIGHPGLASPTLSACISWMEGGILDGNSGNSLTVAHVRRHLCFFLPFYGIWLDREQSQTRKFMPAQHLISYHLI